jgi:phosphatidylserine/phosphatidylglycerophosphate/cardiolipin synthase-like enzyme
MASETGGPPDVSKITYDKAREVAQAIVRYLEESSKPNARPVWWVHGREVFKSSAVQPLVHGDEYGACLLKEIQSAQKYILVTAWAITPSFRLTRRPGTEPDGNPFSCSIVGALCEAQARGIAVRVLQYRNLLSIPSRETNLSLDILRADTIPTRVSLDRPVLHQKTIVIDGRIGFCGGIDPTILGGDRWDTDVHV